MAANAPSKDEIFNRVKEILMSTLKIFREKDPSKRTLITLETHIIDELGVDSLETLDLMNAIEEEFDISPNLSEASTKQTVSAIVDYVSELLEQKNLGS